MTHGRACLRGHDEIHPGGIWARALRGDDLHGLAVAQYRAQRREAPVDLGRHAAVADAGVHGIGEVHHGGAARQAQDLPARGEHVHLVGKQIDLDALDEFAGIAADFQIDEVREPFARAFLLRRALLIALLVFPVRRDARLGDVIHVLGADLDLDRYAIGPEQRRVQRLIAVDARYRDVVLEAPRHRLIHAVDDAEGAVHGVDRIDDDAQAVDVDDLGEREALAQHLAINTEEMLLARLDFALHAGPLERALELLAYLAQEFLLVAAGALERALDHAIALGVERREAQVLELQLHGIEAEALKTVGCDDSTILDHCREPGLHAAGCWVVDALVRTGRSA